MQIMDLNTALIIIMMHTVLKMKSLLAQAASWSRFNRKYLKLISRTYSDLSGLVDGHFGPAGWAEVIAASTARNEIQQS